MIWIRHFQKAIIKYFEEAIYNKFFKNLLWIFILGILLLLLSIIIERVRKKNLENYPTASITKREFWGENFISVTSEDNSNYSVVSKGNISYNPCRANVGSLGINVGEENLAVTSAYTVFWMISDDYLPEYVYLQITKNNEIINRSSGTVRQSLNKDDFLNIQYQ